MYIESIGVTLHCSIPGIEEGSDVLHFAGANPPVLYSMSADDQTTSCIDLYDVFPTNRHRYQPRIHIAGLGSSLPNCVLLHEQVVSQTAI